MKVFSMSQRIYYKDLESEAESIIKKDLELYNCMLHKAFKICFDRAYKGVTYSETDQRMIKSFYGTSDYFPLSTIYEAKALVKSLKCREKEDRDLIKTRLKKIDKKIKKNEKQLKKALKEKEKLINRSKKKKYTEEDYLYEVQVLDPNIKRLKSIICNLKFRRNRNVFKLKRKMPSVCFGGKKNLRSDLETFRFKRSRRMLIPGRRQGKYSNNLFKLNVDNEMLTYRSTQKDIVFKVQFHKYKDELYARVNEKHNSPDKAVAYELMDYGEYFIVKAIFEKHMNLPKTDTLYGAIGIDINVDHIALCETNMDGNIVLIKKYPIHKENTKNKRNEELYQLAIEIMEQCKSKKKSLVVEDLNFKQLKTRMLYRPKKQNKTLSSFAYKKILEKVERKCLMNEVDVIKVDPRNTSKIGKEKYTKIKGLSVHYCAAYVINRRGMGFVD